MLDVHFPTTDGRTLILTRYTELNADQQLLVKQLKLAVPAATAHHRTDQARGRRRPPAVVETLGIAALIFFSFFSELGKLG